MHRSTRCRQSHCLVGQQALRSRLRTSARVSELKGKHNKYEVNIPHEPGGGGMHVLDLLDTLSVPLIGAFVEHLGCACACAGDVY